MESTILYIIIIFNLLILVFAFITKKGLYTITPEKQWANNLKAFDENIKTIDELCASCEYKIGDGHIYNN